MAQSSLHRAGVVRTASTASSAEERYVDVTRRLTRITGGGAAVISALSVVSVWGDARAVAILVGVQLLVVPFNVWVNLHLLPRIGPSRAEPLRTALNLGTSVATSHLTHWPLPAWFWLPFVALAFDQFGQRFAVWVLASFAVCMDVVALYDGVPYIYPLGFTCGAIFCSLISKVRVEEISRMLVEGDQRRAELERANAAAKAAHQLLREETAAREMAELELRHAHKLEAVGRLAAGLAHEINTPAQFVGDSLHFVRDAAADLMSLLQRYRAARRSAGEGPLSKASSAGLTAAESEIDLPFISDELPRALERAVDGMDRIAGIVRSMKEFARPEHNDLVSVDLNSAVASTIEVARSEYTGVAEVQFEAGVIPRVVCNPAEINQVVLNLVTNAAHAIAEAKAPGAVGRIRVCTSIEGRDVLLTVGDDGPGLSDEVRAHIFEPFFTTKGVGKGTGQGLAVGRAIVQRHGGTLTFESTIGHGTTFSMRLPIDRSGGGGAPE